MQILKIPGSPILVSDLENLDTYNFLSVIQTPGKPRLTLQMPILPAKCLSNVPSALKICLIKSSSRRWEKQFMDILMILFAFRIVHDYFEEHLRWLFEPRGFRFWYKSIFRENIEDILKYFRCISATPIWISIQSAKSTVPPPLLPAVPPHLPTFSSASTSGRFQVIRLPTLFQAQVPVSSFRLIHLKPIIYNIDNNLIWQNRQCLSFWFYWSLSNLSLSLLFISTK
jgi:hypothetical protein